MIPASRARLPDMAAHLVLRDHIVPPPVVTTQTETPIRLDTLGNAFWQSAGRIALLDMTVQVQVLDIIIAGSNNYRLEILADDVANGADNPVVVGTLEITSRGVHHLGLDARAIEELDRDASTGERYIAARMVVSGDSDPSIQYGATLVPS